MKKIIEKFVCKNMLRFLKIYQNSIKHDNFNFKKYIDQTVFFETDYYIRLIIEKNKEEQKDGKYKKKFSRSK